MRLCTLSVIVPFIQAGRPAGSIHRAPRVQTRLDGNNLEIFDSECSIILALSDREVTMFANNPHIPIRFIGTRSVCLDVNDLEAVEYDGTVSRMRFGTAKMFSCSSAHGDEVNYTGPNTWAESAVGALAVRLPGQELGHAICGAMSTFKESLIGAAWDELGHI